MSSLLDSQFELLPTYALTDFYIVNNKCSKCFN